MNKNWLLAAGLAALLAPHPAAAQISANYGGVNGGAVRIGQSTTTCDSNAKGALRWNDSSSNIEMCNGTVWTKIIATNADASSDPTPDAFAFTDVTDQSLSALILSNTLNITGFDGPVLAEVSGGGSPQISVNGGPWVTASEINPGDSLRVRLLSSGTVSTALVASVTVGDTTDNWSVTTRAGQTRAFVTSGAWDGAGIGGLAGADAKCQSAAGALGYSGTWKAILSDSTTNAKDRLTITYPVVRASSPATVIDASDIWDGSLTVSVADGGFDFVWTGTKINGTVDAPCSDWTSTAGNGRHGGAAYPHGAWISYGVISCSGFYKLYCVDQ